jgi:hypothetical protein
MCVLFTVLTGIYFFFIKNISTAHYKEQVDQITKDNVNSAYNALSEDSRKRAGVLFSSGIFNSLERYVEETPNVIEQHNLWVRNICFATVGVLLFLIIGLYLVLRYSGQGICIPIFHLLAENMVTFIFVGLVEIYFFLNVVIQYIPIAPSVLNKTIINTMKQELKR